MAHSLLQPASVFAAPGANGSSLFAGTLGRIDDPVPSFSGPSPTFSSLPGSFSPAPFPARLSLDGGDLFIGDRFLLPDRFAPPFDDTLSGGPGDDLLLGGPGRDLLLGGAGDDILAGGDDADRFVFLTGHGRDTVTDFDAGGTIEIVHADPSFFPAGTLADRGALDDHATVVRPSGEPPPVVTALDDGIALTFANGDALTLLGATGPATVDGFALI